MPDADQPGLPPAEVHERVRARFPELLNERGERTLPTGGPLTKALRDAGFDLVLSTRQSTGTLRYLPRRSHAGSSFVSSDGRRQATATISARRSSDGTENAAAWAAEERLLASARRDGFRVLTVRTALMRDAVRGLTSERLGAGPYR